MLLQRLFAVVLLLACFIGANSGVYRFTGDNVHLAKA